MSKAEPAEQERAIFEHWALNELGFRNFTLNAQGSYAASQVYFLWMGWSAGSARRASATNTDVQSFTAEEVSTLVAHLTERSASAVQGPAIEDRADAERYPHIAQDEEGGVTMEWWNGDRKITFYTLGQGEGIRSWGPNIDTEMVSIYPDAKGAAHFRKAFAWLAETQRSSHAAGSDETSGVSGVVASSQTKPAPRLHTLPIEIHGNVYDVPIGVQLHIVALTDRLSRAQTKPAEPVAWLCVMKAEGRRYLHLVGDEMDPHVREALGAFPVYRAPIPKGTPEPKDGA